MEFEQLLNFPYYFYPNIPFCGYMNTIEYNRNLVKLNNLLLELVKIDRPILLHITIGAPAEEILSAYNDPNWFSQWIQLYPNHLYSTNVEIIHIIIAPNKHFSTDPTYCDYRTPLFIKMAQELNWEHNDNCYQSKNKLIKTYVFYTMMPTIDERNSKMLKLNSQRFENICKTFKGPIADQYLIGTYAQTQQDIEFVKQFYQNLHNVVQNIKINNGIVTCFSFAVFCETTTKFLYGQRYNMFKEVMTIDFDLLAEWKFSPEIYSLFDHKNKKHVKYDDDSVRIVTTNEGIKLQLVPFVTSPKRKLSYGSS